MSAREQAQHTAVMLREEYPEAGSITAEVIEGRVVDGFSIEVHGYYGVDSIEVNAPTGDGAVALMLAELERARAQSQYYVWPGPVEDVTA